MNEEISDLEKEVNSAIASSSPAPALHPPSPITLTPEQSTAIDLIVQFVNDPLTEQFKLGGYAGTGKTTIIKTIISELSKKYSIIVSAFTGKACNVLQRKGIRSQTLHSLLYDVDVDPKTQEVSFHKKYGLEGPPDLIIVDEASMISTDLYNDLLSFHIKLLFVGDPGQLEPVGDNPNLMAKPDFVLTKIHRQAESSPIITLATSVRNGGRIEPITKPGLTIRKKQIDSAEALSCDQLICAKNATRESFNNSLRTYKKFSGAIVEGEKLICLRNNLGLGVFNGMILFVTKVHGLKKTKKYWTEAIFVDCEDEVGRKFFNLPVWNKPFVSELTKKDYPPKDVVHCTYGYVITCHKSQGSEWKKVLIWDEWMPPQVWNMARWRYTAITRAAEELIYNI